MATAGMRRRWSCSLYIYIGVGEVQPTEDRVLSSEPSLQVPRQMEIPGLRYHRCFSLSARRLRYRQILHLIIAIWPEMQKHASDCKTCVIPMPILSIRTDTTHALTAVTSLKCFSPRLCTGLWSCAISNWRVPTLILHRWKCL